MNIFNGKALTNQLLETLDQADWDYGSCSKCKEDHILMASGMCSQCDLNSKKQN